MTPLDDTDRAYREQEEDRVRRPFSNCGRCQHPKDLHDETGCRAEWGSYNDREFCQCTEPFFGNVVPDQGFDEDEV